MTYLENPRTEIDYTFKASLVETETNGITHYQPKIEVWMNGIFLWCEQTTHKYTNKLDALIILHTLVDVEILRLKDTAEFLLTRQGLPDTIEEK